jgi:hypothetical protein
MKKLTGIYKISTIKGSYVEISKKILNNTEYCLVSRTTVAIINGSIIISETTIRQHKDFFRHVKSI